MKSTVSIYHGYESDGRMVFGYGKTAMPEIAVFAYSYQTDKNVDLDIIYRRNNAVDGTEYNVLNEARSLSVGDIIGIAHPQNGSVVSFYLVEVMGFTLIASDGELPSDIELVSKDEVRARQRSIR